MILSPNGQMRTLKMHKQMNQSCVEIKEGQYKQLSMATAAKHGAQRPPLSRLIVIEGESRFRSDSTVMIDT